MTASQGEQRFVCLFLVTLLLLLLKPTAHESQNHRGISYSRHNLYLFSAERCEGPILELFLVFNQWVFNAKYKKVQWLSPGTKPAACQLNDKTITCHQATFILLAFLCWSYRSQGSHLWGGRRERKPAVSKIIYSCLTRKKNGFKNFTLTKCQGVER